MTTSELLSKAEDYISRYVIDLKEMRFSGVTGDDVSDIEREFICELAGMQRLMSHLYRIVEEEEL